MRDDVTGTVQKSCLRKGRGPESQAIHGGVGGGNGDEATDTDGNDPPKCYSSE